MVRLNLDNFQFQRVLFPLLNFTVDHLLSAPISVNLIYFEILEEKEPLGNWQKQIQ